MALYRRGAVWWIDITTPNGRRVRHSTRATDKQAAQEFHDTIKAELWRRRKLKEKPRRAWQEAVVRSQKGAAHTCV